MVRTRRRRHRPVLGKMDTNLAVLIAVLQEKTQLIGGLMIHVFFSSCLEYNLIGYLGHILNHNSNFFQTDSHCTLYFALCESVEKTNRRHKKRDTFRNHHPVAYSLVQEYDCITESSVDDEDATQRCAYFLDERSTIPAKSSSSLQKVKHSAFSPSRTTKERNSYHSRIYT
jgi:hypothetical protein